MFPVRFMGHARLTLDSETRNAAWTRRRTEDLPGDDSCSGMGRFGPAQRSDVSWPAVGASDEEARAGRVDRVRSVEPSAGQSVERSEAGVDWLLSSGRGVAAGPVARPALIPSASRLARHPAILGSGTRRRPRYPAPSYRPKSVLNQREMVLKRVYPLARIALL